MRPEFEKHKEGAEEIAALFKGNGKHFCLVDPSHWMAVVWDNIVAIALIFTGLFTPWEVAFLPAFCFPEPLFLLNRFVDGIFVCDMVLQFFLIREVETTHGTERITNRWMIAKFYFKGWFTIDTISILPFDTFGCMYQNDTISQLKVDAL